MKQKEISFKNQVHCDAIKEYTELSKLVVQMQMSGRRTSGYLDAVHTAMFDTLTKFLGLENVED